MKSKSRSKQSQDALTKKSLKLNSFILFLVSSFGLLVSSYALYVELKMESDSRYKPLCDISPRLSCSAAFVTKYGRGLGLLPKNSMLNLRNPVFGIAGYVILMLLSSLNSTHKHLLNLLLILTTSHSLTSIYLIYVLYVVLYNFCPVCFLIHVTNFSLLGLTIYRKILSKRVSSKKRD